MGWDCSVVKTEYYSGEGRDCLWNQSGHRSRALMISTLVPCVTVSYNTLSLEVLQHWHWSSYGKHTVVQIYMTALNSKSMKQKNNKMKPKGYTVYILSIRHTDKCLVRSKTIKFLITYNTPLPCCLIHLRSKYPSEHPILKLLQATFLPQCDRPYFTTLWNYSQNSSCVYPNIYVFC